MDARSACAAGDVERGIKILADYLATTEDVTAIYNMGRCYQQNGLADKALLQFREYLRQAKDLSADQRKAVETHIREIESDRLSRTKNAPAADAVAEAAPDAKDAEDRHRHLRSAGLAVGGAGVLALGTGVYFSLRTSSLEDRVTNAMTYSPDDYSSGKTARTMQYVMYGIGVAALAGGAVLYYLGLGEERVALVPTFTPTSATATLRVPL